MRFRIHRTDGGTGTYAQEVGRRAENLVQRLDPEKLFTSGPIMIGVLNPFSLLNPDEICWVAVETELETKKLNQPWVEHARLLSGREEYEELLARQWPRWRKNPQSSPGDLLEALVELSFRGNGGVVYVHVVGTVGKTSLVQSIFGMPAVTATYEPNGTVYLNPQAIVRTRVYHSLDQVSYPNGIWFAEAEDI